jgi:hypothetical protein
VDQSRPDELTLARIERERAEASQRLAKTRDIAAWQATMSRLDAEGEVARQPRQNQRLEPAEAVAYLRSLPSLWADSGPEGRQALATALFAKTEVLGYERMTYELTPDAIGLGLDTTLPAEFVLKEREFGRGERASPDTPSPSLIIPVTNVPSYVYRTAQIA